MKTGIVAQKAITWVNGDVGQPERVNAALAVHRIFEPEQRIFLVAERGVIINAGKAKAGAVFALYFVRISFLETIFQSAPRPTFVAFALDNFLSILIARCISPIASEEFPRIERQTVSQ